MNKFKICRYFFNNSQKFDSSKKQCYYKILGLGQGEDSAAVKRAFMKLAKKYHPDVNQDEVSQKRFQDISEAYAILSDPQMKYDYDKQMRMNNIFERDKFKKQQQEQRREGENIEISEEYLRSKLQNTGIKDPLNNLNFKIDYMKVKNDKDLKFVKEYIVFNKGTEDELWQKKEDFVKESQQNELKLFLKEIDPITYACIFGTFVTIFVSFKYM